MTTQSDTPSEQLDTIGYHLRMASIIARDAKVLQYTDEMKAAAQRAIAHLQRVIERCEMVERDEL